MMLFMASIEIYVKTRYLGVKNSLLRENTKVTKKNSLHFQDRLLGNESSAKFNHSTN